MPFNMLTNICILSRLLAYNDAFHKRHTTFTCPSNIGSDFDHNITNCDNCQILANNRMHLHRMSFEKGIETSIRNTQPASPANSESNTTT